MKYTASQTLPAEQHPETYREVRIGKTLFKVTAIHSDRRDFDKTFMDWAKKKTLETPKS